MLKHLGLLSFALALLVVVIPAQAQSEFSAAYNYVQTTGFSMSMEVARTADNDGSGTLSPEDGIDVRFSVTNNSTDTVPLLTFAFSLDGATVADTIVAAGDAAIGGVSAGYVRVELRDFAPRETRNITVSGILLAESAFLNVRTDGQLRLLITGTSYETVFEDRTNTLTFLQEEILIAVDVPTIDIQNVTFSLLQDNDSNGTISARDTVALSFDVVNQSSAPLQMPAGRMIQVTNITPDSATFVTASSQSGQAQISEAGIRYDSLAAGGRDTITVQMIIADAPVNDFVLGDVRLVETTPVLRRLDTESYQIPIANVDLTIVGVTAPEDDAVTFGEVATVSVELANLGELASAGDTYRLQTSSRFVETGGGSIAVQDVRIAGTQIVREQVTSLGTSFFHDTILGRLDGGSRATVTFDLMIPDVYVAETVEVSFALFDQQGIVSREAVRFRLNSASDDDLSATMTHALASDADNSGNVTVGDTLDFVLTVSNTAQQAYVGDLSFSLGGDPLLTTTATYDGVGLFENLAGDTYTATVSIPAGDSITVTYNGTIALDYPEDAVTKLAVVRSGNAAVVDSAGATVPIARPNIDDITLALDYSLKDDLNGDGIVDRGDSVTISGTLQNTGAVPLARLVVSGQNSQMLVYAGANSDNMSPADLAGGYGIVVENIAAGGAVNFSYDLTVTPLAFGTALEILTLTQRAGQASRQVLLEIPIGFQTIQLFNEDAGVVPSAPSNPSAPATVVQLQDGRWTLQVQADSLVIGESCASNVSFITGFLTRPRSINVSWSQPVVATDFQTFSFNRQADITRDAPNQFTAVDVDPEGLVLTIVYNIQAPTEITGTVLYEPNGFGAGCTVTGTYTLTTE